jgi:glyoxylase-like metal-dependent hydrolase (beta-lactamase superfamily II)
MTVNAPSAEGTAITVAELYERVSQPNNLFILDVRNEDEFEAWQIEGRYTPDTINIPYHAFFEDQEELVERVPTDHDVVVVCAHGGASDFVALVLEEHGRQAANLTDGMIAWGNYYITRPVVETPDYQVYQVDRAARGCLSHILISDGQAVLIDPLRHIDQYQKFLEEQNAQLALILDTHAHADHISGGPALAKASGAPYHLHPYDGIHPFDMLPAHLSYEFLKEGQRFQVGQLDIEVIHTPGHTLGQVNFLVNAPDGQAFLFTGDNIFIESFGRPDLGGQGERWAPVVYETIFETIGKRVPEHALMLPGHYAQAREAGENGIFAKPMRDIWNENNGLQFENRDSFVEYVLDHLPTLPEQYIEIKRVNIGLSSPDEDEASELELGKNICALSTAY